MSGQSIMDRMAAAKHSIAGQGLAKSVCKATTEEIIGPKKKHLDYLLQCTNEPNVSIPQLADLLIERTQHSNWVVVYKSLITIHNLVNYGNERFTQYLASNNCSFNLSGFVDKGGVQGYDMSTFIRRYAKYLNEKAVSYRQMAFDFCKVKRGKDDGLLRTMNAEKLLKALPVLQAQLDALLEFDCTPNELTNGVINACFMLLFKDLIRLFACYNDGIINLLEKYFDMNKKQCKDGLDLYKKFLVRMEKVSEFLKVAENVGIDKGDIPDLAKGLSNHSSSMGGMYVQAPASLLEALEQHLTSLEGKKGVTSTSTTSAKPAGFSTALNTMTTNSSALSISETEKKKILDEESRHLQQLKASDSEPTAAEPDVNLLASEADDTNIVDAAAGLKEEEEEFGEETAGLREGLMLVEQRLKELTTTSSPPTATSGNLFGAQSSPPSGSPAGAAAKPSDDLLSLSSNPFADSVQSVMASAYTPPQQAPPPTAAANNPFASPPPFQQQQTNGFAPTGSGNNFTSDADFARAFNSSASASPAAMNFGPAIIPAINNAPPALDLGSPLDPLHPSKPLGPGTAPAHQLLLGDQTQAPPPASPSRPMAIPGAYGGGAGMGFGGLSTSPGGGPGAFSSSPMGGPLSSSPMVGLSSSPMGVGYSPQPGAVGGAMDPGAGPFGQMGAGPGVVGAGPGALGLSASPAGAGRHLSRSPSPTLPDTGSFGRASPNPGLGVEPVPSATGTGFDAFGDVLQPLNTGGPLQGPGQVKADEPKLLASDLDTSLASLASNLSVKSPADQVKKTTHQWQPKGESKLTGGNTFQQRPVIQSNTMNTMWTGPQPQYQPQMMGAPQMGAPQMGFAQPQMAPGMAAQPMMGMGQMRPGMVPMGMAPQQPMMYNQAMPGMRMPQQQPPPQAPHNDPFGAL